MDYPFTRISLDTLQDGPWAWEGDLPADAEFWSIPEIRFDGRPRLKARAEQSADGSVGVSGSVSASYALTCSRCLGPMTERAELPLGVWFRPGAGEADNEDRVFALEPGAAEISLLEPLREELLLGQPDYPVCASECRGLCPRCGTNLNESACECSDSEIDPRWGPLRGLLTDS